METADEQTSEIEKQQSHAVGRGNNRQVTIDRKALVVYLSLFHVTLSVVCGVEVICTKERVLLRAKKCMNCGKLNHFPKVCRSKPTGRSRSTRPQKPSKGKHRARLVDIKSPSGSEASTPATAGRTHRSA